MEKKFVKSRNFKADNYKSEGKKKDEKKSSKMHKSSETGNKVTLFNWNRHDGGLPKP